MANDVAEYTEGGAVERRSESSSLLIQIVEASRDPAVDAEKMQAMANLAIQLQDREQQQQFNRDLNAAIAEMPVITKAGRIVIRDKNTQEVIQSTAYEKFEDLDRIVKPIARKHNIQYNFDVGGDDKRLLVTIILRHSNGYVERSGAMPLPLETSGSKNNVQGAGSTNTYGKRYALKNAFAISVEGEDDDGNQGQTTRLTNERANLVLDEAAAAHAAGQYNDWFRRQSPKDRGYLVTSGKHAEYGGEAQLPPPKPDVREKEPVQAKGSAETYDKAEVARARQREQWVERYVGQCAGLETLDALTELLQAQKANLDKFRDGYPDLWSRISVANSVAYERLSTADGNQDDSSGGDDLFGAEGK